jgi:hypothetical protein
MYFNMYVLRKLYRNQQNFERGDITDSYVCNAINFQSLSILLF